MFRPMRPAAVRRPVGAPLLRGALIGGAAYGMGRRDARDARQDQAIADPDLAGRLTRLGEMAQQGLLDPDEFAAAKARLLGPGG